MSRGSLAAALAAASLALVAPSAAHANSFPLVGWWPMNEGSGQTVRDWSGRGNNGTLGTTTAVETNDPAWIKGVFLGSALRFDGDDFVSIPGNSALEPARLTVAAWIRGDTSPGPLKYVMSKGSVACLTSSYGVYTGSGGGLAFYVADNPYHYFVTPEAPATVWDGKWHHVAGTFDGAVVRLFVDGVEVGTGTPAATTIDYNLGSDGGQIGNYPGTCTDALTLKGDVDGVQVWSQALPISSIWNTLRSLFNLAK
jgi:Concanavalin A-like lectin/glucanases superfamily